MSSDSGGQIQACGYVRVVQPLTHPAVAGTVRLAIRSPRDLAASDADVILVQRVAIQDMETAERVLDSCRRRGARLVFEIDDDLFHIPDEHPESEHYLRITKAARWLAEMADAVLTSTEALRQQMLSFNLNTIVVPNVLDDRFGYPGPPASHSHGTRSGFCMPGPSAIATISSSSAAPSGASGANGARRFGSTLSG